MSKKKAVDKGSFYYFPQPEPLTKVKPGKYYPGWVNNIGFVLFKNEEETELEEEVYYDLNGKAVESQPGFEFRNDMSSTELENTAQSDPEDLSLKTEEIFGEDYQSERYFPMEEYNKGLKQIDKSIHSFINNKEWFLKNKIDYKRSALLFSVPGTGKTWYLKHISEKLIEQENAIVMNVENSSHLRCLSDGMQDINRVMRGQLKVIIIEELAEFCRNSELKTQTLQLLDSPFFRDNMLFLVTTNEPELIPQNLIDRPSRLDVLAKIDIDEYSDNFIPDWYTHNTGKKLPESVKNSAWFQEAKDILTPVYWSELFKFSELQSISLKESWQRIKERKRLIKNAFSEEKTMGFN